MTTATAATTKTKSKKTTTIDLAARESSLRAKYRRIVPGSIRFETSGSHAGKCTVVIRCATKDCKNTRRVATSDLFQVRHCEECTKMLRNKKRRAARKLATKQTEAIGVS